MHFANLTRSFHDHGPAHDARIWPLAVAVIALAAFPHVGGRFYVDLVLTTMILAIFALSLELLVGHVGLVSFGHAAFFGVGAYTSTLLLLRAGVSPWLGMLAGGALAAAFGLFQGYLSFRYGLRGPYFSLVTLAFAEMLRVVAVNAKAVGGSLGLVVPTGVPAPWLFVFGGKLPYYYVILGMTGVALLITAGVARGRLGYALIAVRENEDAAEAAGVNALGSKLAAMALSSFLTALGGTFYAQYFAYIDPTITFGPAISIQALLPAIVGGAGTVLGPLLGSFALTPISELTRAVLRGRAGADIMLYGLILVLVISFLPQGLMGWRRAVRRPAP
jgi:branched-chain amino acid transport system permease protein